MSALRTVCRFLSIYMSARKKTHRPGCFVCCTEITPSPSVRSLFQRHKPVDERLLAAVDSIVRVCFSWAMRKQICRQIKRQASCKTSRVICQMPFDDAVSISPMCVYLTTKHTTGAISDVDKNKPQCFEIFIFWLYFGDPAGFECIQTAQKRSK